MKREDYLRWSDYFMALAKLSAMRSKDPTTQVGACIVGPNNRVLAVGYNGFPNGCDDDDLPWGKVGDFLETKYAYVVHAEENAIMNSNRNDLGGSTLYITLFPCNECAKMVVQAGISRIFYLNDHYHDRDFTVAARKIFDLAGVEYIEFNSNVEPIEINLRKND